MTLLPLVAAIAWTAALIASGEPLGPEGSLLSGLGLLSLATVSVVGMTITGGRWAHRLGMLSVAAGLVIAAIRPVDVFWFLGLTASSVAGASLFMPQVTGRIRQLPAATGPPQTAVLVTLVLLTVPFVLGVLAGTSEPWALLSIGLSAPVFAFGFSRVIPGGLIGIRVVWPLMALGLSPLLGLAAAAVSVLSGLVVAAMGWRSEVKAAFHPPRESGSTYPIPPELVPGDILDAADIDDRGHRR
jgi:hypothetical protein